MTRIVKFANRKTGETIRIKADFAQADSQIQAEYRPEEGFVGTPFRVADAKCRPALAAKLAAKWGLA